LVRPAQRLARAVVTIDRRGLDATVVGTGRTAGLFGAGLRLLQNGNVQAYLSALLLGVLVVLISVSVAVAT
jgi:NADH-quinone oxidoreductase subunit L